MEEIDFIRGEIRSVRAEDFESLVPGGHVDFEVELRLGIAEVFPGFANLTSLLFALPFAGSAGDNGGGLQALSGAKNTIPEIVGSDDGETNRFAAFFGEAERLREKMLFDAAEELIGVKFLFAGSGTAQDADVKGDNIAATGFNAIEDIREMVEIILIADGDEDIARACADGLGGELAFDFEIELIHLDVRDAGLARSFFGDGEDDVKKN